MKKELSELISDIKEQVLYLQELGVSSLNAELPDFQIEQSENKVGKFTEMKQQSVDRKAKPEYIVPDFQFSRSSDSKPAEKSKLANTGEGGDRLSRLPSLSNRPVFKEQNLPPQINKQTTQQMPIKKKTDPSPTETLFGDISQSLPIPQETLTDIQNDIGKDCTRCRLCENRTQVVNSVGNPQANLMFIGEAPGADEDVKGEPFVGRAGQLLTKIIEAIGFSREEVFIGNINRCRPPQNRQPQADEAAVCKPFLIREIAVVRPKAIVVMGNTACQNLLETKTGITKLRGIFQDYYGVKVMPTFHPAYLLRDPHKKREVWEDMKKVRDYLNESE